jgi:hypothetical protein
MTLSRKGGGCDVWNLPATYDALLRQNHVRTTLSAHHTRHRKQEGKAKEATSGLAEALKDEYTAVRIAAAEVLRGHRPARPGRRARAPAGAQGPVRDFHGAVRQALREIQGMTQ